MGHNAHLIMLEILGWKCEKCTMDEDSNVDDRWWMVHCDNSSVGRGHWLLASCEVSWNSDAVSDEKWKMSQPIRACGGHLGFLIGSENTNLVEGIEYLLPVKFQEIMCSSFRGEDEIVSANQSLWRPSWISDRLEKHKIGRGHWGLASCKVWWNSVQRFQRRSRKCLSQSEPVAAILDFRSARKTQTW